jgi:membrane protein YdbS with pleckstrin-like domain
MSPTETSAPAGPTNPLDPPGLVWHPLSKDLTTVRLLGWLIRSIPIALGCLIACLLWHNLWVYLVTAGVVVMLGWSGVRIPRWVKRASYGLRDKDLFYRSGLLIRSLDIVPYVRIQYVDINVGPLERLFNLASISVNTASPSAGVTIPGLPGEVAAQLRDILTDRGKLTGQVAQDSLATGGSCESRSLCCGARQRDSQYAPQDDGGGGVAPPQDSEGEGIAPPQDSEGEGVHPPSSPCAPVAGSISAHADEEKNPS